MSAPGDLGFSTRIAGYGITIETIERVMSDNAFAYRHATAYTRAVAALSPGARRKFVRHLVIWRR